MAGISSIFLFIGLYVRKYYPSKNNSSNEELYSIYEEYRKLWKLSSLLPHFEENEEVNSQDLLHTSNELTNWYFSGGFKLLSDKSSKTFTLIQDELREKKFQTVKESDYHYLKNLFGFLQSEITSEMIIRNKQMF
ncbi:hypothetical protein [Abyssalbus ytuae]|uniref:Uncharacterized protein n=1 Tax=Abyssalbus ytuae TaxID=2926907 RepID=A0A9E6ZZ26_9FLAO|nr:hypothetical protein [Abyssalbus ytuae]UOB17812.1 hypothetical protein MQE35_00595 [Abyssalbus ytuae]